VRVWEGVRWLQHAPTTTRVLEEGGRERLCETVSVCAFEAVRGPVARFQHEVCALAGGKCLKSQCPYIFTISRSLSMGLFRFCSCALFPPEFVLNFLAARERVPGAPDEGQLSVPRPPRAPHCLPSLFSLTLSHAPGFTPLVLSRQPPNLRVVQRTRRDEWRLRCQAHGPSRGLAPQAPHASSPAEPGGVGLQTIQPLTCVALFSGSGGRYTFGCRSVFFNRCTPSFVSQSFCT
jgi:hypothetical protein